MTEFPDLQGYERFEEAGGSNYFTLNVLSLILLWAGFFITYPQGTLYYTQNPLQLFVLVRNHPVIMGSLFVLMFVMMEVHEQIHLRQYQRNGYDADYRRSWLTPYVIANEMLVSIPDTRRNLISPLLVISVVMLAVFIPLKLTIGGGAAFIPAAIFASNLAGSIGDVKTYIELLFVDDDVVVWASDTDELKTGYYRPTE